MMSASEVITPTTLGFHCDGTCWAEQGKERGFIKHLEAISTARRDWFSYGDWATKNGLEEHELPPASEIHPIQDFIVPSTVEEYRAKGYTFPKRGQEFFERYPTLFKWDGKWFIFQGTHRLAARLAEGHSTYYGWMIDTDSLTP